MPAQGPQDLVCVSCRRPAGYCAGGVHAGAAAAVQLAVVLLAAGAVLHAVPRQCPALLLALTLHALLFCLLALLAGIMCCMKTHKLCNRGVNSEVQQSL